MRKKTGPAVADTVVELFCGGVRAWAEAACGVDEGLRAANHILMINRPVAGVKVFAQVTTFKYTDDGDPVLLRQEIIHGQRA